MTDEQIRSTAQVMLNLFGTVIISFIGFLAIIEAFEAFEGQMMTWAFLVFGGPFVVIYILIALFGLQSCYRDIWESNSIGAYIGAGIFFLIPFGLSWITSAYWQTSLAICISLFVWSRFVFSLSSARFEASRK